MVHVVKEGLEVDVDRPGIPVPDVSLGLQHRLLCAAARAKPVALIRKMRVKEGRQDLEQCLLDQSVDDGGNTQVSDSAAGLRNFDPSDRLRLIGPREEGDPDVWPMG